MATSDTTSTGPAWTVTGQVERTIIDTNGNAADVMVVSFTLEDGTTGTVNVPLNAYTVANVNAAILAKAQVIDGVNGLSN